MEANERGRSRKTKKKTTKNSRIKTTETREFLAFNQKEIRKSDKERERERERERESHITAGIDFWICLS